MFDGGNRLLQHEQGFLISVKSTEQEINKWNNNILISHVIYSPCKKACPVLFHWYTWFSLGYLHLPGTEGPEQRF